jgi:hypothetical protein
MTAFPDIQVFTDDVVVKEEVVEYHWTFTGTWVRICRLRGVDVRRR